MSDASHTPGPWTVEDRRGSPLPNVRIVAGNHEVAQVSDVHMRCHQDPKHWTHEQADAVVATGLANARLIAAAPDLLAALAAIVSLEPREFTGFPADWHEQIAACEECRSCKHHPIQQGICNTHRKPIWAREAHERHEQRILGIRAAEIARAAIAKAGAA